MDFYCDTLEVEISQAYCKALIDDEDERCLGCNKYPMKTTGEIDPQQNNEKACLTPGCKKKVTSKGLCANCYARHNYNKNKGKKSPKKTEKKETVNSVSIEFDIVLDTVRGIAKALSRLTPSDQKKCLELLKVLFNNTDCGKQGGGGQ